MFLIDTHAHLYSEDFNIDLEETIQRAKSAGVKFILLPNVDLASVDSMKKLISIEPSICKAMMGLHPTYVKEDYLHQLSEIKSLIHQLKPIAIGEIGLDFYWDTSFASQQKEALETQLNWASELNLPVAIHTRKAWNETVEIIKPFAKKGLKGVFHCFSGSKEQAKEVEKMGWYLGLGGVITYKNAGMAEVIPHINPELIVLETDCPYLTPVPFRGKRNEPSYLTFILDKIAEVTGKTSVQVAEETSNNAQRLFNLFS